MSQLTNTVTESRRIICTPTPFASSTLYYLQEIGQLKSLKPHVSSREALNSYLFIGVLRGEGTIFYNHRNYELHEGDYIFMDCNTSYRHQSSPKNPWELVWIHFNGTDVASYYSYFNRLSGGILFHPVDIGFYHQQHQQLMVLADAKSLTGELKISQILYHLITQVLLDTIQTEQNMAKPYDKMLIIKEYIDEHLTEKLSLDFLAQTFYISKYYLAREFKKAFGITIVHYIHERRITKSKELLRYSDLLIEEVGRAVGISDPNYFNKVFQKLERTTAREYRRRWR